MTEEKRELTEEELEQVSGGGNVDWRKMAVAYQFDGAARLDIALGFGGGVAEVNRLSANTEEGKKT